MTPHRHADPHKPAIRDAFLAASRTTDEPTALLDAFRILARPALRLIVAGAFGDARQDLGSLTKDDDTQRIDAATAAILAAIAAILGPTERGAALAEQIAGRDALSGAAKEAWDRATAGLTDAQVRQLDAYRAGQMEDNPPGVVGLRVDRMSARLRVQRAERIAEDQAVRASSAGQEAFWHSAIAIGAIDPSKEGKRWTATHDHRVESICQALDGTVVPFGHPFPGGFDAPPAHPRCRCVTTLAKLPVAVHA